MNKIFVLGKNRSGIKWLSNILLNSDEICGLQSEYHRGILETNLLVNFPNIFGELGYIDNYIAFVETFSSTDFFKLTGLDKDILYRNRFYDYLEVFNFIMEEYTKREGEKAWLQKAHIFNFTKLYNKFPDAKFIIIERNIIDNIKSAINYKRKVKIKSPLFKKCVLYVLSKKIRKKIVRKYPVFFVKYSDLKRENMKVIKALFKNLGIFFKKDYLNIKYKKNTSFSDLSDKKRFSNWFTIKTLFYYSMFSLPPLNLLKFLHNIYRKCFFTPSVTGGSFSMISDEYSLEKVGY